MLIKNSTKEGGFKAKIIEFIMNNKLGNNGLG